MVEKYIWRIFPHPRMVVNNLCSLSLSLENRTRSEEADKQTLIKMRINQTTCQRQHRNENWLSAGYIGRASVASEMKPTRAYGEVNQLPGMLRVPF